MVTNYVQNSSLYGVGESVVGQVRKANEDNCGYASTENGELFVVCDGMGGHVGGATASKIGVESIINYISTHKHADKRVILRDALVFANMQILGTASADATLKGMGTTACIVLIDGDNTWLAHVGDSRIYLYSQKDKFLYRVSKDHSFVQGLVDSGQLDDRDAENHPQKNIILRALGIKEDMKPEVDAEPMHCAKGDIIMICSDGLSGMIDDVYMEKKIRDNKADLADLCQQLIDDANTPDKGKDNITCQLIRFEKAAAGAPKHPDFTPKWRRPGSAVAGAATAPVAGSAPAAKPKKMLWIGLAVLVILLAGGIVGGMMYIAKHRHVFRQDARTTLVLRSDSPEGIDMNAELRPGATPIEWTVNAKGVSIDDKGYLHVDSTTYEAVPATRIKVRAEFQGKEYIDSILVRLEYVKVVRPVVEEEQENNVTEDDREQQKQQQQQQEKLRQEQEKQKQEQLKQQQEKQKQEQLKQQQEKQQQEQQQQQEQNAVYFVLDSTKAGYQDVLGSKILKDNKSSYDFPIRPGGFYRLSYKTKNGAGKGIDIPNESVKFTGDAAEITYSSKSGVCLIFVKPNCSKDAKLTLKYSKKEVVVNLKLKK